MGKAENTVEGYLRKQCAAYGFLCYKFTSPGHNGVPDEIIIKDGNIIFVETKSPVGHLSEIQKKRISEMKDNGADVRVCHTRKSIDKLLREFAPDYVPASSETLPQKQSRTARTKQKPVKRRPIRTEV